MCRWLAYVGRPILLDRLLFKPENSLIDQSMHARRAISVTNGDGFGVGWYGERPEPGLYRDILPAWNDDNLKSLAEQIRSPLFCAHVRASTGTAISRVNCHPFRFGRWLFMHNGQIGGYDRIARDLHFAISPEYYAARIGTTDSETLFCLLLSFGLDRDPEIAFAKTVGLVEKTMKAAGIEAPLRITAAAANGEAIYALRYASDGLPPSLYYGSAKGIRLTDGSDLTEAGMDSLLVLSEPLDTELPHWAKVPSGSILFAGPGAVEEHPFTPAPPAA